MQIPTVTIVMLKPLTVQIFVSDEVNVTVSDDVELGDTAKEVDDQAVSAGSAKVIVCAALVTVIDCVWLTDVAPTVME